MPETQPPKGLLAREEYVEQAHFFCALREGIARNEPLQELLRHVREEILATTKLPLAVDFLLTELRHCGQMAPAMRRLAHYFSPFQAYVVGEAEEDRGRFDMRVALEILRFEAQYRSTQPTRPGAFLYQFEALCRNRLRYEQGLDAMAQDPIYDQDWAHWIQTVRRQIGIVDFADLVYVRSERYVLDRRRRELPVDEQQAVLFGEKEGRIAAANRRKDPLFLFAALQRQLGYPQVPRLQPADETPQVVEQLGRRVERLETRLKLLEEEQRGGIDLTRFYGPGSLPKGAPKPMD